MKTYKKIVIAALANVVFMSAAPAQVIGVDFYNGDPSTDQTPLPTDVVGPDPSAGWNNTVNLQNSPFIVPTVNNTYHSTLSPQTLIDNSGSTTTAQIGFTQGGYNSLDGTDPYAPYYGATGAADNTLTPNQQLYNGATQSASAGHTQEVTLNNVPYTSYSVYLLVEAVSGNSGYPNAGLASVQIYTDSMTATPVAGLTYYLASGSASIIPSSGFSYVQGISTSSLTPTNGANYVEFTGLTSSNVSFDIDSPSAPNNAGAYFGGIEIVNDAVVPEPSTYALMLAGFGVLVVHARRRLA